MKWMTWLWMTSSLLIALPVFGASKDKECGKVKKLQLTISAHGSNIANEETTRTPEGGSYKRQVVKCQRNKCRVETREDFLHLYEPEHPDADANGYVQYPNIEPAKEINKFMAAISELELIAKRGKCGLSHEQASKGFIIKYDKGEIQEDHFILPDNILITGWKRTLKNGQDSLLSFSNF
ncbi:MAG: hypothetical protein EP326_04455 [Deltaproteobacteria bacterium]|nr:MAG: hypothetical protein EP326_04455 [Deltaproteobacteria bacterium]TNF25896.1 MAG: hypothetical protein EP319_15115 [Deltaproteobacteria bacterium]